MGAVGMGLARIARPALAGALADALGSGSVLLVAGAGYGKTMALEEAIELADYPSVWLSCADCGGDPGRLLSAVVEGLRAAVPGLADVAGERLAAGLEPVDVTVATAALVAEVERLLSEPLVLVFDDAEELEHQPAAVALIERLLGVRGVPLSLAIATRRALPLKVAKLRAGGRLLEVGPAELSFTASECEELLGIRHGRVVHGDELEAVIEASEGWPMGVALSGLAGSPQRAEGAVPQAELFAYLAEEVLDRLGPGTRSALIDSSVPATLTPQLAGALGLPAGFLDVAERQGLFLRADPSGAYSYHPLFRAFLRGRLDESRSEEERASLHARAAEGLAASGRAAEAVEQWIAAKRDREALEALATFGGELVRTSPGKVREWLAGLPAELRGKPDYQLLDGQLLWGAGQHERALEPLRAAVSGHAAAGDQDRAWLARVFLADTLLFVGDFGDVSAVAKGWEQVTGPVVAAAMALAWYEVVALSALGRLDEAEALRTRLRRDPGLAAQFTFLDVVAQAGIELVAGPARAALARLHAAIAELEQHDPFGRLPYALGMVLAILRSLGEREAALVWLDRCERESVRLGLGFALRDFRLQRASLLAQRGDLSSAEAELAGAGKDRGTGWRAVYEAEAEAHVAALRGDGSAATAAQRALDAAARAPMPWRVLADVEMADVLIEAGAPALARSTIDVTLAELDDRFAAERGRRHRAWLLAARACLEHKTGDPDRACATLRRSWAQAGDEAGQLVRAHWPSIQPVLWEALANRTISPETVLPAIEQAFPAGDALVALADHPDHAVRRAALSAALAANHPAVLERLAPLIEDRDERIAAAAAATRARLRSRPPPLRFELLGGFRVRRGGWELGEASWQRPMAARVVRFLLLQGQSAVPEDELFEAFWADRPADAARQHLTVAVSRARKVLDLPGAEHSVIEARERTYRLRMSEHDTVDAEEFERAAATALAEPGRDRTAALERAAALWTGEPSPEDRYAAWSVAWRDRLVETYSHVLSALLESHDASARHHDAISAARRLLALDPHNEQAHRQLMLSYARTGRTNHALRQYLECRRALVVDLGVEPSAETSRLQARILAGESV